MQLHNCDDALCGKCRTVYLHQTRSNNSILSSHQLRLQLLSWDILNEVTLYLFIATSSEHFICMDSQESRALCVEKYFPEILTRSSRKSGHLIWKDDVSYDRSAGFHQFKRKMVGWSTYMYYLSLRHPFLCSYGDVSNQVECGIKFTEVRCPLQGPCFRSNTEKRGPLAIINKR